MHKLEKLGLGCQATATQSKPGLQQVANCFSCLGSNGTELSKGRCGYTSVLLQAKLEEQKRHQAKHEHLAAQAAKLQREEGECGGSRVVDSPRLASQLGE